MGILDRLMFWRNRRDNDDVEAMDGYEVAGCFTDSDAGSDDLVSPDPDAGSNESCAPEPGIVDESLDSSRQ